MPRFARHDSGFALPEPSGACFSMATLPDPFSSDSESISPSSPHSFASSSSSLASSPALLPTHFINTPFPELSLADTKPSGDELSSYAASIIRNEAYALLALASRIAPASHPIEQENYAPFAPDNENDGRTCGKESRSNLEFRRCVEMLAALPSHGKILVSGVGKSGIVARKMVATFNSLG